MRVDRGAQHLPILANFLEGFPENWLLQVFDGDFHRFFNDLRDCRGADSTGKREILIKILLNFQVMHIEGTALIVYMDSFLRYEKVLGFHITGECLPMPSLLISPIPIHFQHSTVPVSECACFSSPHTFATATWRFVGRPRHQYFALKISQEIFRPHIVRNYTGARLLYFFIPAAVLGTTWLVTVEICEQPTPFNSEYLR